MALSRQEITKRYNEKYPERVRETKKRYYLKNKSKLNIARKKAYLLNKDKENQSCKDWYEKNKEYRRIYTQKYRKKNKKLFQKYKDLERFGGNKEAVFQRDKYLCRLCSAKKSRNNKPLIIHHIDGSGQTKNINNSLDNLITLCARCHHHTHRYQKKEGITFQSIKDIVRTMTRVIEVYRNMHPVPRIRRGL